MIRYPAVAGAFYPSDPIELRKLVLSLLASASGDVPGKAIGAVVPHAGYVYSGRIAAAAYKVLEKSTGMNRVVVVGPNHTGAGAPVSVFPRGEWVTPLGTVRVDEELTSHIIEEGGGIADVDAHIFEHSVEVQLPFLQTIYPAFSFAPIVMMDQSYSAASALASATPEDVVFIASSDFSHYLPADVARKIDEAIIERILALDAKGVEQAVHEHNASVCGYGPIMALVEWAKRLGAKAELLAFGNSGDVTGDYSNVVDYAAVVFYL